MTPLLVQIVRTEYWSRRNCSGWRIKQNEEVVGELCFGFVAELDDDCVSPIRSLRDTTTQDTDEPEIQPVSEPQKSA